MTTDTDSERQIEVLDVAERSRYEVRVDGELAGFAEYRTLDGASVFHHTEVDDAFAGMGLAKRLAVASLGDAREAGVRVVPLCPFYAGFIEKNPEYADLVDTEMFERLRG